MKGNQIDDEFSILLGASHHHLYHHHLYSFFFLLSPVLSLKADLHIKRFERAGAATKWEHYLFFIYFFYLIFFIHDTPSV